MVFLTGCSFKEQVYVSKSLHVSIKSKKITLNETGFLTLKEHSKNLQIFAFANPLLDLHVKSEDVCEGLQCMDKKRFNEDFFGYAHYKDLIDDILDFAPLYEKKNIHNIEGGFEQILQTKDYEIFYRVTKDTLYFKDSKNGILIKLKELK
jgi:hypothetical protein